MGTSCRLAAGMAGADLAAAAVHARQCTAQQGSLVAAWKLLGDVQLQHHSVTPASAVGLEPSLKCVPPCTWVLAMNRAMRPGDIYGGV